MMALPPQLSRTDDFPSFIDVSCDAVEEDRVQAGEVAVGAAAGGIEQGGTDLGDRGLRKPDDLPSIIDGISHAGGGLEAGAAEGAEIAVGAAAAGVKQSGVQLATSSRRNPTICPASLMSKAASRNSPPRMPRSKGAPPRESNRTARSVSRPGPPTDAEPTI